MKETFGATSGVGGDGVLEEIGAEATVSGDIKESVCNGEQNMILPNTQSINGLKRVSQLCPSTAAQLESNGVTENVTECSSPKGKWTGRSIAEWMMEFVVPLNSWSGIRLIS